MDQDKRKESLKDLKICRFCCSVDSSLSSIYDRSRVTKNVVTLTMQIMTCVGIEVFPSDGMPSLICDKCRFFMEQSYQFKQVCRQADEVLLQYVQTGELTSIPWPKNLIKSYNIHNLKSGQKDTGKAPVCPRKVAEMKRPHTIQQASESEDDEEDNVLNIQIETGEPSEKKDETHIRVVASGDKLQITSEEDKKDGSSWPCPKCERSFPLHQLLVLHEKQMHRERNIICELCDERFFTKYDLNTHMVVHSDDMPFECVACGKKFKRIVLLRRHERSMHSDLPQYPCLKCENTQFLSQVELEAHMLKHKAYEKRRFVCACKKRFINNRLLERHIDVVHTTKLDFGCDYCPFRFSSGPKLARHVRNTHAGERPYPCKYCSKSFMKSHHYTRHLRLKHEVSKAPGRATAPPGEQYKCEQCEEAFDVLDDLVYHSALHATEDLICPLCKEQFDDVNTVTTHIKSHIEGEEFMCEFCELMFTCGERLEEHVMQHHAEELADKSEVAGEVTQDEGQTGEEDETNDGKELNDFKADYGHGSIEASSADEKMTTNSEDSENETPYSEMATVNAVAVASQGQAKSPVKMTQTKPGTAAKEIIISPSVGTRGILSKKIELGGAVIKAVRRVDEKADKDEKKDSKVEKKHENKLDKKDEKDAKPSDKSLRLLEKELQDLKSTSSRPEGNKPAVRGMESIRGRRPLHASTPKISRYLEPEKKLILKGNDKKNLDRRSREVTGKEMRLSKEVKEMKDESKNADKMQKELKDARESKAVKVLKETKVQEPKVQEPKVQEAKVQEAKVQENVKVEQKDDAPPRRSSRPSRVKDYAKMADNTKSSSEENSEEESEEDTPKPPVVKGRGARTRGGKTPIATLPPRKRGRPPKSRLSDEQDELPNMIPSPDLNIPSKKLKKESQVYSNQSSVNNGEVSKDTGEKKTPDSAKKEVETPKKTVGESSPPIKAAPNVIMSPTGQPLTKVPASVIKSLPPGVKPMPLPPNMRPMASPGVCEMKLGQKTVKVQKIVMTKAEIEAMAKKGLVEMKDGAMVLKPGIKLPLTNQASRPLPQAAQPADKSSEEQAAGKLTETDEN